MFHFCQKVKTPFLKKSEIIFGSKFVKHFFRTPTIDLQLVHRPIDAVLVAHVAVVVALVRVARLIEAKRVVRKNLQNVKAICVPSTAGF